jgi:hypothetical protein
LFTENEMVNAPQICLGISVSLSIAPIGIGSLGTGFFGGGYKMYKP